MKRHILLIWVLALVLFTGCNSTTTSDQTAVVTIDGAITTKADFDKQYHHLLHTMRLDADSMKGDSYKPLVDILQHRTIDNIIVDHLVAKKAAELNLSVSDTDIQTAYTLYLHEQGSEKELLEGLKKQRLTKDDLLHSLQQGLLREKVAKSVSKGSLTISDKAVRSYYHTHPQQFKRPEQVHARHILIMADADNIKRQYKKLHPDASDTDMTAQVSATMQEKEAHANSLLAKVQASPDTFEALAKEHSEDSGSSENGGDLGFFHKGVMVPEFSKAAFATKAGQIHPKVVKTQFGFHVIQVLEYTPAKTVPFATAKSAIRQFLEDQKKSQAFDQWLTEARTKVSIVIAPEYDFEKKMEAAKQQAQQRVQTDAAKR